MDVFYYRKAFDKSEILANFRKKLLEENKKNKDKASPQFLNFLNDDKNFVFNVDFYQAISLECTGCLDVSFKTKQNATYVSGINVSVSESEDRIDVSPEYSQTKVKLDRKNYQYFNDELCSMACLMSLADVGVWDLYDPIQICEDDFSLVSPYKQSISPCELKLGKSLAQRFVETCIPIDKKGFDLNKGEEVVSSRIDKIEVWSYNEDSYSAYIFAKYKISFVYNGQKYEYLSNEKGEFEYIQFCIFDTEKIKKIARRNLSVSILMAPISVFLLIFALIRDTICMKIDTDAKLADILEFCNVPVMILSIVFVIHTIKFLVESVKEADSSLMRNGNAEGVESKMPNAWRASIGQNRKYFMFLLSIVPIAYIVLSYFI